VIAEDVRDLQSRTRHARGRLRPGLAVRLVLAPLALRLALDGRRV